MMLLINKIIDKTLDVFKKANVHSFPIDCKGVIYALGYEIKQYSSLPSKKRNACMALSEDSCLFGGVVYYNDAKSNNRIRFSMMHELGHGELCTEDEKEADIFASNMLAPRMAIHYSNCKNYADVMKHFSMSEQASQIAFNDYKKWLRTASHSMSIIDKEMYQYFFNSSANKFVWSIQQCKSCYSEDAYNEECICNECKVSKLTRYIHINKFDEQEHTLDMLRGNWLYCDK